MATKRAAHPSVEDRTARGNEAREKTPLPSHVKWKPAADRPDPISLLEKQNADREADLVPVRHGRMMVSPFTFYRGAAMIMAADLKGTPVAGLTSQLCGDAHLSNFGLFGSPERRLLFDLNDFDETLPGPFEFDVKRLVASFTIAARHNGFSKSEARAITTAVARRYRQSMRDFAGMRTLDIWYASMSEDILDTAATLAKNKEQARLLKRAKKTAEKARTRDSLQALSKLAERVNGKYQIVSNPPVVIPIRDLRKMYGFSPQETERRIKGQLTGYTSTLDDDRRELLSRYKVVDVARKVVGVGSVGTRAFIALMEGRDDSDPLFLQVKEANPSVLEYALPKSKYRKHGERVVRGQRMMQAASDIFLGWYVGPDGNHFYWRQLRDMKGSAVVEGMVPAGMAAYGNMCAWTLARAHARSGDPVAMAAYLGDYTDFEDGMTDFAGRYADQNERDYESFIAAIKSGRLQAIEGV
jgi:uncharacterized protein (DUF2252 family)